MKKSFKYSALALVFISALAVAYNSTSIDKAAAHSGATGIVKQRMDGMKAIAAATKSIAKLDWSSLTAARNELKQSARVLKTHASEMVALFPKGSIEGPSEATDAIWDRPAEFAALAKKLETSAGKLIVVSPTATGKENIAPMFRDVAATCKACHSDFRQKK